MRYCFFCGLPLNEKAVYCGYCGRRQPDAPVQKPPLAAEKDGPDVDQTQSHPAPEPAAPEDSLETSTAQEEQAVSACPVDWGAEIEAASNRQNQTGAEQSDTERTQAEAGKNRPPKRRSRKAWSGLPSLSGLADLTDRLSDKISDRLYRHWDQELARNEKDLDASAVPETKASLEEQIDAAFAQAWPVSEETPSTPTRQTEEPDALEDTVLDAEWYSLEEKAEAEAIGWEPEHEAKRGIVAFKKEPEEQEAEATGWEPEREAKRGIVAFKKEPGAPKKGVVALKKDSTGLEEDLPAPHPAAHDAYLTHVGQLVENPSREVVPMGQADADDGEMQDEPEKKRHSWWIWVVALCGVAAVGIGGYLWYQEPIRSFDRAFSAGEYSEALAVYQRAAENENKAAAIQARLEEHIAAIYQDYLDQDLTIEEAIAQIQTLNGFPFLAEEVQEIVSDMNRMEASRQAYAQAEAALEAGDYLGAIEWVNQVIPEDSHYADAQSLRERAIEAQAQLMLDQAYSLLKSGDYTGAFAQLDAITETLGPLPQVEEARTEYVEYIVSAALDAAADLANQGNYSDAVARLQQTIDFLGGEADAALVENLTHMQQVYTSYIPVSLLGLSIYATDMLDDGEIFWSQYLTDNQGTGYSCSLAASAGSITYLLDGKYQNFSGVVGFPADAHSSALAPSARLEVYGDGVLLWTSGEMSSAVSPVYMDLYVEPYNTLSLKWVCTGLGLWNDWGYYATLFDPTLQPVPIE